MESPTAYIFLAKSEEFETKTGTHKVGLLSSMVNGNSIIPTGYESQIDIITRVVHKKSGGLILHQLPGQ